MEAYLLMIFVTIEQEKAIRKLFKTKRWDFKVAGNLYTQDCKKF